MARAAHVRIDTTMCAVGATTLLGCLVDLDVLNGKHLGVEALGRALLSAFLRSDYRKVALFSGQRPWVTPQTLAWAHLPTPPLNLRKGTHCFFSLTSSKYFYSLFQAHVLEGHRCLTGVLEVNPKVLPASHAGFK